MFRSSQLGCSVKKCILRNFAKILRKIPVPGTVNIHFLSIDMSDDKDVKFHKKFDRW